MQLGLYFFKMMQLLSTKISTPSWGLISIMSLNSFGNTMRPKWSTFRTIPIPFIPWLLSFLLKAGWEVSACNKQASVTYKGGFGIAVICDYLACCALFPVSPVDCPVLIRLSVLCPADESAGLSPDGLSPDGLSPDGLSPDAGGFAWLSVPDG
jgi:hypothetical protein